jgi:hypothetical protein
MSDIIEFSSESSSIAALADADDVERGEKLGRGTMPGAAALDEAGRSGGTDGRGTG